MNPSGLSGEKDIVRLAAKEHLLYLCTYAANEWTRLLQGSLIVICSFWKTAKWIGNVFLRGFYLLIQGHREALNDLWWIWFSWSTFYTWNSISYCARGWVHWPCQRSEQGFLCLWFGSSQWISGSLTLAFYDSVILGSHSLWKRLCFSFFFVFIHLKSLSKGMQPACDYSYQ